MRLWVGHTQDTLWFFFAQLGYSGLFFSAGDWPYCFTQVLYPQTLPPPLFINTCNIIQRPEILFLTTHCQLQSLSPNSLLNVFVCVCVCPCVRVCVCPCVCSWCVEAHATAWECYSERLEVRGHFLKSVFSFHPVGLRWRTFSGHQSGWRAPFPTESPH